MKRILIIVTALFTNTAIAQLVNGTPFNYCTLNGDQYNPGTHPEGGLSYYHNMWVTTNEDDALSNSEVIYLRESFLDNYPISCTWSVEPAAMFQNASGSGTTASLSYATPY